MSSSTPLSAPTPTSPRARLAALVGAHFLNDGAANFLPGVLPFLLVGMGVPVSLAGTLMAALLLGQGLQPVTGWLADRIGGRVLISVGLAGSSLGGILVALAPSLWTLAISLVLLGVCNSCFHPPAMASVRVVGGQRQGRAMSIMLAGGEIGRGLWPLLASGAVALLGLRWIGLLCLPGLIAAIPLYRYAPELPRRHAGSARVRWREHGGPLGLLVGVASLRSLMIVGASTYLPILWQQRGHSLVAGASVISVFLLVGIIGNLGGGHFSDRFGHRAVLVSMLLLAVLTFAGVLVAGGVGLWLLLGLFGVAVFATLPITVLLGQEILPENPAMGAGVAMGFSNALAALALALLGPLAVLWGVHGILWVTAGGGVLAALLAWRLPSASGRAAG